MTTSPRMTGTSRLALMAAIVLALAGRAPAQPQAFAMIEGDIALDSNPAKPGGFSVKKEDAKVNEQLEDFARYRDKKAWDRAFKALAGVNEATTAGGMSPDKDGFYVPTKEKIFRSLLSLPPAGREAYRLFNDAKAKQLWEAVLAKDGAESTADLRKLVEQYFITAVGPKAADRLGDAYFEAGDYTAAARAWGQVLEAAAGGAGDDSLSPLRLHFKRATALFRSHRGEQFAAAVRQIRDRFPREKLTVGGREVDAAGYLESLTDSAPTTRPATHSTEVAVDPSAPLQLPAEDTPSWQMQFLDPDMLDKMFATLQNSGWGYQAAGFAKIVPPAATDGSRIYANWCGIVFAVDAKSGKLLWRSGKFTEVADKFMQLVQNQVDPNRFALTVAGDSVLTVSLRLDKLNNQEPFRLFCYAGDTGKKKWGTDSGALSNWGFVGKPLVVGDVVYLCAHPKDSQDINLLALSPGDGKLLWQTSLGMPQVSTNYRGMPVYPLPTMLHQSGTLYVLTNNGALVAIDLAGHSIEWAFTYEIPPPQNMNMGWNPYNQMLGTITPAGALVVRDGTLYFKESGLAVLHALDPVGPTLKWKRPVETSDMLAGFDDKNLYLLGLNLSAVDLTSRTMLWSPAVPVQTDAVQPVFAAGRYYVFTGRGIYSVDIATQDVRIFHGYDRDSFGGALLRGGDKLISVSNLAITAYSVKK